MSEYLSIGQAAFRLGVAVETLRRWDRDGRFRPVMRTAGGHRRYSVAQLADHKGERANGLTICYARVSCSDQKDDLARQAQRLLRYASERGWACEVIHLRC